MSKARTKFYSLCDTCQHKPGPLADIIEVVSGDPIQKPCNTRKPLPGRGETAQDICPYYECADADERQE